MDNIRIERWCGYDIRFVEHNGEWLAILKDICDALGLRTDKVAQRLDPHLLERVLIERDNDSTTLKGGLNARQKGDWKTHWMLAVYEPGIYQALFASRKLEARKFVMWTSDVLQKLRKRVGLEQYEVMRMTEPEIQEDIDHMLDDIFFDEETGILMESVTVAGGDVIQVPFEG